MTFRFRNVTVLATDICIISVLLKFNRVGDIGPCTFALQTNSLLYCSLLAVVMSNNRSLSVNYKLLGAWNYRASVSYIFIDLNSYYTIIWSHVCFFQGLEIDRDYRFSPATILNPTSLFRSPSSSLISSYILLGFVRILFIWPFFRTSVVWPKYC